MVCEAGGVVGHLHVHTRSIWNQKLLKDRAFFELQYLHDLECTRLRNRMAGDEPHTHGGMRTSAGRMFMSIGSPGWVRRSDLHEERELYGPSQSSERTKLRRWHRKSTGRAVERSQTKYLRMRDFARPWFQPRIAVQSDGPVVASALRSNR